jgi:hypothetical protein
MDPFGLGIIAKNILTPPDNQEEFFLLFLNTYKINIIK